MVRNVLQVSAVLACFEIESTTGGGASDKNAEKFLASRPGAVLALSFSASQQFQIILWNGFLKTSTCLHLEEKLYFSTSEHRSRTVAWFSLRSHENQVEMHTTSYYSAVLPKLFPIAYRLWIPYCYHVPPCSRTTHSTNYHSKV